MEAVMEDNTKPLLLRCQRDEVVELIAKRYLGIYDSDMLSDFLMRLDQHCLLDTEACLHYIHNSRQKQMP